MFRGDLSDRELTSRLVDALGTELPGKLRIVTGDGIRIAWMSPDELLLMTEGDAAEMLSALSDALQDVHHLLVDVSAMRVEFEVTGPIRDVLSKGTPTDLSPGAFAVGDFRRSRIGQIQAAFWLTDDSTARIACRRSEAEYLAKWLDAAVKEGSELGFHHR